MPQDKNIDFRPIIEELLSIAGMLKDEVTELRKKENHELGLSSKLITLRFTAVNMLKSANNIINSQNKIFPADVIKQWDELISKFEEEHV